MTGNNQSSKQGKDSTSIQIGTLNQGLSYTDVREIFNDLMTQNLVEFKSLAKETAEQRSKQLFDSLFKKIQEDIEGDYSAFSDPSFQLVLQDAQLLSVKSDNREFEGVIVEMIAQRAKFKQRDLKQLLIEESLKTLGKLTQRELDILTTVFVLRLINNNNVVSHDTFKNFYINSLLPFANSLPQKHSVYQYLAYSGCASISIGSAAFEDIMDKNYRGLFFKGFTTEDIQEEQFSKIKKYLVSCLNANNKYQINAINKSVLEELISNDQNDDEIKGILLNLFDQYKYTNEEILEKIYELLPDLKAIALTWNSCPIKSLELTSVGIYLANANYQLKTKEIVDFADWI